MGLLEGSGSILLQCGWLVKEATAQQRTRIGWARLIYETLKQSATEREGVDRKREEAKPIPL